MTHVKSSEIVKESLQNTETKSYKEPKESSVIKYQNDKNVKSCEIVEESLQNTETKECSIRDSIEFEDVKPNIKVELNNVKDENILNGE